MPNRSLNRTALMATFAALTALTALTLLAALPMSSVRPAAGVPSAYAQQAPGIDVEPDSASAGATITLRAAGWPAGASLSARMYQASDTGGPGAFVTGAIQVGADGAFAVQGMVPRTLFGPGNRGNVEVVPGAYTIVVRQGTERSASVPFTVTPPAEQCFAATDFCVAHDPFWDYFMARGAIDTFGYPVSRTFPFLGCTAQFFQRQVFQQCGAGPVQRLNLLDPGLMPVDQINFSTFPAHDPAVATAAPAPDAPSYGQAVLDHLRATVPDTFEGLPVDFFEEFMTTVPGSGDPAFRAVVNLEVWGFPTSPPAFDPHNRAFVYQRFQRGIMHYDHATGATGGILLADWFKAAITGQRLPPDLAAELQGSRFLRQYCPDNPRWLCRPDQLPATDLTTAFEALSAGQSTPPPTATPLQPTVAPSDPEGQQAIDAALLAAARHLNIGRDKLQVLRLERREWPDTSLGCPQPDMAYAQVITPGYLVELGAAGEQFEYHTDTDGHAVLCQPRR
ncbi:MAG: hypothetical protein ACRDI2_09330 [Chloroflexota bacterium]